VSRRTLTLLLSGLLAALLTGAASAAPVPYVAYTPGPTFDTLGDVDGTPVISVEGRETFPTEGRLDLTTISVRPRLTLGEALRDWFDRDRAVVPRELLYPPGETDEQVQRENEERRLASESSATSAALRQLGVPFTTTVEVQRVEPGLPADGRLQAGDVVTSVEGSPVQTSAQLRELVSGLDPGSAVRLGYVRDGAPAQTVVTTAAPRSGDARSVIGVVLAEKPDYPFEITISLEDVGGPSAGLMFALGIIEKLQAESLTGGRYIAGTGEISVDGTVGPIGGIPQKLVAARDKGAEVFLVPDANCEEALGQAPDGLQLVRVSSLQGALDALRTVRDGGTPPSCAS
jgi:PDZ domain-containing protein